MTDDAGRGRDRETGRSRRGFAAMNEQRQREIARLGGQASAKSQKRDERGHFAGGRSQERSESQRGAPQRSGSPRDGGRNSTDRHTRAR
jgi:hypothetical protein